MKPDWAWSFRSLCSRVHVRGAALGDQDLRRTHTCRSQKKFSSDLKELHLFAIKRIAVFALVKLGKRHSDNVKTNAAAQWNAVIHILGRSSTTGLGSPAPTSDH
jgi:hypothetical protein